MRTSSLPASRSRATDGTAATTGLDGSRIHSVYRYRKSQKEITQRTLTLILDKGTERSWSLFYRSIVLLGWTLDKTTATDSALHPSKHRVLGLACATHLCDLECISEPRSDALKSRCLVFG